VLGQFAAMYWTWALASLAPATVEPEKSGAAG
jgi:hypothetical protein